MLRVDVVNSNNPESHNDSSLTKRRPDGIITSGKITIGYVEVKPITEKVNTHKINKDLLRLGVFGKNAIDQYSLNCSMVIQAVGTNIDFYLVERVNSNLYQMTQLDQLYFPDCRPEIPML